MGDVLYADHLLRITEDAIIFERYYFPFGLRKVVPLSAIERVGVAPPSLSTGKWRLHGSGGFTHWFPMDMARPTRDRIFMAYLNTQAVRIGFTAVDGERVEQLLRKLQLLR